MLNGKLQNLMDNLRRIEIVLKILCSKNANLLKAESSIQFLLSNRKTKKNFVTIELHQRLLNDIP